MFVGDTAVRRGRRTLRILGVASEDCRTLILSGELDLSSSDDVEAMISQVCADTRLLTIDLSRLTFMDWAGIHVLAGASVLCARKGCEFSVTGGPAVQRLAEVTGLVAEPWFHDDASARQ